MKYLQDKKIAIIALLGAIGSFNAAYLTMMAFDVKADLATKSVCDISETLSCSSVFGFDFAWIFGIPFPMIALLVYPVITIIALLAIFGKIKNHYKILLALSIGGVMFNGYIIYNETLVGAYCPLCLMCTVMIIIIGILSKCALCTEKKCNISKK